VLARANNRAISLAVLGKRVGAATVECCGQRIMITCGMSGGLSSSTTMRSLPLILPSARALLGDDVVTASSIPVEGPFRSSHPLAGPANWESEARSRSHCEGTFSGVFATSPCALQIPPHPFPAEGLELPQQRRRAPRMDPAPVDRPRPTTPHQHPHPTPQHPTPTRRPEPTTTARCSLTACALSFRKAERPSDGVQYELRQFSDAD